MYAGREPVDRRRASSPEFIRHVIADRRHVLRADDQRI